MSRMSAKIALCNSVTLDMSGGFLLMMLLYLWQMLWLVGCITVTHFSGVSQSYELHCIQNSAARSISNTSAFTGITPVLKKLH